MQKEDKDIIVNALLLEIAFDKSFYLSEDEQIHCINKVDPNLIPKNLYAQELVAKNVNWKLLNIEKLKSIANFYPSSIFNMDEESRSNIKFKEIRRAFVVEPNIFYSLNYSYGINLDDEDIYHLIVNCDIRFLDDFIEITKKFNTNKQFEILKASSFDEEKIKEYNIENFDSYYISEIAKNAKNHVAEILPLNKVKVKHWIELLEVKPHLINHFDINQLRDSDSFYTVCFVTMFPEYEYLIDKKILSKLSKLSWDKLTDAFPEKYEQMIKNMDGHNLVNLLIDGFDIDSNIIDKSKINIKEWIRLLRHKKEYVKYFDTNKLTTMNDIIDFIEMFPNKSYVFPEERKREVTSLGWEKLMKSNKDYFFDLCDFYKLTEVSWENIIRVHPELKVHKF